MAVQVEVKLDVESVADYMSYKIYTSAVGITSVALGILNIGLVYAFAKRGDFLQMGVFIIFSVLLLIGFPYFIRSNVRRKMGNARRVQETAVYEFDDEGVTTTTADDSGKASWGKFTKAVVTKKRVLLLFAGKDQAIVLPLEQIGEYYEEIARLICEHMPAPAVRIRRPADMKNGE